MLVGRRAARLPIFLVFLAIGCGSRRATQIPAAAPTTAQAVQLSSSTLNQDVEAYVVPPVGWTPDPLKKSSRHTHQVWIAPTGSTAYGVMRFSLPLPVGHDLALWGFLREMKRTQGEAILLTKQWNENLQMLQFVADGGIYRVRVNLIVDGRRGWAVYAGTRRDREISAPELELAEIARDHTIVGINAADR